MDLAPYEMGVSQILDTVFKKQDVEDWVTHIFIERTKGDKSVWRRANPVVADRIRKQVLLLGSISDKSRYEKRIGELQGGEE